jgi:putative transposase
MAYNPEIHRRQSIRLPNHDYSQSGVYFITMCTYQRAHVFGQIIDGQMILNNAGHIAKICWHGIPNHFQAVHLDEFIVMPNHMHGIVVIHDRRGTACRAQYNGTVLQGTACRAPTVEKFGKPISGSIATIVRSFKSATTKQINILQKTSGEALWQRNYWERIIRNDHELHAVRQYIRNNPAQWQHGDLYDM